MTTQVAPYKDPSLGTGFTEASSIVVDRFDGFTKIDSIVLTASFSFVKEGSDAPTKLVALNLSGDSKTVTDPEDGAVAPLRDGQLQVGQSYTYTYKAGFGYRYSATGTVVGIEQVVVPFGTIETYKIIETYTIDKSSNPSTGVDTAWVHPILGAVKYESDLTVKRSFLEGGTSTEHQVLELVSTNIPFGDG